MLSNAESARLTISTGRSSPRARFSPSFSLGGVQFPYGPGGAARLPLFVVPLTLLLVWVEVASGESPRESFGAEPCPERGHRELGCCPTAAVASLIATPSTEYLIDERNPPSLGWVRRVGFSRCAVASPFETGCVVRSWEAAVEGLRGSPGSGASARKTERGSAVSALKSTCVLRRRVRARAGA